MHPTTIAPLTTITTRHPRPKPNVVLLQVRFYAAFLGFMRQYVKPDRLEEVEDSVQVKPFRHSFGTADFPPQSSLSPRASYLEQPRQVWLNPRLVIR